MPGRQIVFLLKATFLGRRFFCDKWLSVEKENFFFFVIKQQTKRFFHFDPYLSFLAQFFRTRTHNLILKVENVLICKMYEVPQLFMKIRVPEFFCKYLQIQPQFFLAIMGVELTGFLLVCIFKIRKDVMTLQWMRVNLENAKRRRFDR